MNNQLGVHEYTYSLRDEADEHDEYSEREDEAFEEWSTFLPTDDPDKTPDPARPSVEDF